MAEVSKRVVTKKSSRTSIAQESTGSSVQTTPLPIIPSLTQVRLIEPVDYETELIKRKEEIQADGFRDILEFPNDNISVEVLPQQIRTEKSSVPVNALNEAKSLFVRETVKCYTSDWHTVENKYEKYAGSFAKLQRAGLLHSLPTQVFQIDHSSADQEDVDDLVLSPVKEQTVVSKSGYLTRAPLHDNPFPVAMKSYKKKWFVLRQQPDAAFVLEHFKDDKGGVAKGTIVLDNCTALNKVTSVVKGRKYGLELVTPGEKEPYGLFAETDEEIEDWIKVLAQVVRSGRDAGPESRKVSDSNEVLRPRTKTSVSRSESLKESLRNSMNPELLKYASETDAMNASNRQVGRLKLFEVFSDLEPSACLPQNLKPQPPFPRDHFNKRILIEFEDLKFRITAFIAKNTSMSHVEPFFTFAALYDANKGQKISEDFHFNLNDPATLDLISSLHRPMSPVQATIREGASGTGSEDGEKKRMSSQGRQDFPTFSKRAIFAVTFPNPDIYLVVRIEKVLQGGITTSAEPYMKAVQGDNTKMAEKIQKQAQVLCKRLSNYRMPFAWTARPLFKDNELDMQAQFTPIYKQERDRLTDEDLLQMLTLLKSDRLPKLAVIPGTIRITVREVQDEIQDVVTPTLLPVKPSIPPSVRTAPPNREVQEFVPLDAYHPHLEYYIHASYCNHLYVYPISLKLDTHKGLKARNIACCVQLKDSDEKGSKPLTCVYGKAAGCAFVSSANAAVLYHSSTPTFYEEVKINLPVHLHERHHLLFTFFHVAVEAPKGSRHGKLPAVESVIGYSWLRLLDATKLLDNTNQLPVSTSLPPGYLAVLQFGLGKGFSGPRVEWIDSCRPVFKVNSRLVSTVNTQDQPLQHFFWVCDNTNPSQPAHDVELCRAIKGIHSATVGSVIQFLPVIMNQLLRLVVRESPCAEEVAGHSLRALIYCVELVHNAHREEVLNTYLKYVFMTDSKSTDTKKVHEELVKILTKLLRRPEENIVAKLLRYTWFFFDIILKSMAQHLVLDERMAVVRARRFSTEYNFSLGSLVGTYILHIWEDHKTTQARYANRSLADFVKECFTYMDRGSIFRLVNRYMEPYESEEERPEGKYDFAVLSEFKFEFLEIVCSHEHFVQLNLPFSLKEFEYDLTLSDEFCRKHFLVGLLQKEVAAALDHGEAPIRRQALRVLRNLLAKHDFDDRYNAKKKSRIASLYLPFVVLALEHTSRLNTDQRAMSSLPNSPSKDTTTGAQADATSSASQVETAGKVSRFDRSQSSNVLAPTGSGSVPPTLNSRQSSESNLLMRTRRSTSLQDNRRSLVGGGGGGSRLRKDSSGETGTGCDSSVGTESRVSSRMSRASMAENSSMLEIDETRDLLVCVLFILKHLDDGILAHWWQQAMNSVLRIPPAIYLPDEVVSLSFTQFVNLLDILQASLLVFRYTGLKAIRASVLRSDHMKQVIEQAYAQGIATKPAGSRQSMAFMKKSSFPLFSLGSSAISLSSSGLSYESEIEKRMKLEGCMTVEVSMIVLDLIELISTEFQLKLELDYGDNVAMRKVFNILITFFRLPQSEAVLNHVFATFRAFVNKFPSALFQGNASFCEALCYETLMVCNSPLKSVRSQASTLLYLILRGNYEFVGSGCARTHIQCVAALSKMIGSGSIGSSDLNLKRSLATVAQYGSGDEGMAKAFVNEVSDLSRRLRDVLKHTASLKDHEGDPEMLVDLQYKLAQNYTNSPEQRKAWLDSMSLIHLKNQNFSEAAHCHIHIAALIAEYLRRKGEHASGCNAFEAISPNIPRDERGGQEDKGMADIQQYSELTLVEELENCVDLLDQAERYEVVCDVYQLLLPIYHRNRDYEALSHAYGTMHQACKKIVEVTNTGRRMLGTYFRVGFYGQPFGDDHLKQYIYCEPKITPLPVISQRLEALYKRKHGYVEMIKDSAKFDTSKLLPNVAYVQLTFVEPFFTEVEKASRRTEFERRNNIQRFMYETPFTKSGKAHGDTCNQWIRKTILTVSHCFPYVKKRIEVVSEETVDLTPIEVGIEEMGRKVVSLRQVCSVGQQDKKKLQLLLQGAVMVTVNAGPLEYANVFLKDKTQHSAKYVERLKEIYRDFSHWCGQALELNGRLIQEDQLPLQQSMEKDYREMCSKLEAMIGPLSEISDGPTNVESTRKEAFSPPMRSSKGLGKGQGKA
ncbi:dedicator of cytokinesis protein 9-like [Corticium candelabrum]|uniref:dedicator of cytokinesis protein 9-like n=1 Tax=Corticium candelabrum TaxID=121492 RepID=UPI002E26761A|nr:dedicator of cytokinesis protein 9-like [Corticium candelabrum]